ncbi:hypothetical protein GUITHDRAFT_110832 [Guillardia theta CCMP2712]|uniref:Uncharacterized protein n=1 Tax=Guillardia theta (strain CCMP2712) TaxID=905079 RepID=L1J4T6_GUITC|nr:hypothetical protein GUITHDRAFT_110832 [Guillardia theta CCMP2712]EKX43105.1 hypothetical protein GUITHDRAFT_110832 [Guillardia theta CCMP2712]|eukprot:XP_005830085.1 hypothetical protein GUITHDRAFT_110832 [Guillardia theta CCMP2712]
MNALVTGGASGIGAALSLELARRGVAVTVVGRDPAKLNSLKEAAEKQSSLQAGRVTIVQEQTKLLLCCIHVLISLTQSDIATSQGRRQVVELLKGEASLSFLVNNAAVGTPDRLQDITLQDFEEAMAVNVTAPLFLSQQLLPLLEKAKGGGRILNVGSGIADRVQLGTGTYGITKKALHRLSLQMTEDLAGRNVHVAYVRLAAVDDRTRQSSHLADLLLEESNETFAKEVTVRRSEARRDGQD